MSSENEKDSKMSAALVLGAIGVVFGDIGTSPLYALRECMHIVELTPSNLYGILSLIFWALTLIVSIKYLGIVMLADNKGEGGVLTLMSLAQPHHNLVMHTWKRAIVYLGIFGAALLYGDGIITPAISVLSAIEGLKVVTPVFENLVVPITIVILIGLFLLQKHGTARIGSLFGPIVLIWFLSLGLLGLGGIAKNPAVLWAMNPMYAISFIINHPGMAFMALGSVFLVVTGSEALYADMGHFGVAPIKFSWFAFVLPGLILNYFGQGALLLTDPAALENPFYHLAPEWCLIPLVVLATMATVTASQAIISGAFSLTSQAIKLGFLPRMTILHTSKDEIGQIYVPKVNAFLLVATLWLVLEFKSSSALASAYGIAVSTTMVITTILVFFVARRLWGWGMLRCGILLGTFLVIELFFWFSNLTKVTDGGWIPIVIAGLIMLLMTTWRTGRKLLRQRLMEKLPPFDEFITAIPELTPIRVPGTAIYMNTHWDLTPPALLYNLKHNKVIHERILITIVLIGEVPHIPPERRLEVEHLGKEIYRVIIHYGYMDSLHIPEALKPCREYGIDIDWDEATFFMGRETLLATIKPGMALWREALFSFMARNAQRAARFFGIKADQVIEIGFEVEL